MIMLRRNKNQRLHEDKFIYDPASEIMIICFSFLFSDRTTKSVLYAITCDNPVFIQARGSNPTSQNLSHCTCISKTLYIVRD